MDEPGRNVSCIQQKFSYYITDAGPTARCLASRRNARFVDIFSVRVSSSNDAMTISTEKKASARPKMKMHYFPFMVNSISCVSVQVVTYVCM